MAPEVHVDPRPSQHSHLRSPDQSPSFWKSPAGLAWLVAALVGGFYLVTEHRAHLFGALPYLILLACTLMHLFMHKGHGHGHHGGNQHGQQDRGSER